jgi:hypothetical protein
LLAAPSENPKNAVGNINSSLSAKQQQVQDEIKNKECNDDFSVSSLNDLPSNKVLSKTIETTVLPSTSTQTEAQTSTSDILKEEEFLQMVIFVTSAELRAVALPSYHQIFQTHFSAQTEHQHPLICASTTHIRGHPALLALNVTGCLIVMSLPSFKMLLYCSLISVNIDDRICQRLSFSEHGCGMNMVSSSEVQKFTVSAEIATQVFECKGELFVPCDMPEPPKAHSFLRGVVNSLAVVAGVSGNGCGQMVEMDALCMFFIFYSLMRYMDV